MIPGHPGPHTTVIPHPAIETPQVKQEHPHADSDLMHVQVRLSSHGYALGYQGLKSHSFSFAVVESHPYLLS